jgi:methyltransferase
LAAACLVVVVAAQALRYWAIASLGERWNVRVIVEPGIPVEVHGPYRYLRHPNYVAVVLEGLAVPLVHGAWLTALAFSVSNAVLLAVRIRCEERALGTHCAYAARLGGRSRFVPSLHAPGTP